MGKPARAAAAELLFGEGNTSSAVVSCAASVSLSLPRFCSAGGADLPTPLEDRPLGTKIHFEAIHHAEGKTGCANPRSGGRWAAAGNSTRTPMTDVGSERTNPGSTASRLFADPGSDHALTDTPDPDQKGRKVYDVVPEAGEHKRKYSLVLSPTEAGTASPADPGRREGRRERIPWWTRTGGSTRSWDRSWPGSTPL